MKLKNLQEKQLKLKGFHSAKRWKYFGLGVSANRTEYIVTNDLTQSSKDDVEFESQTRWKIEEFHREVKQLTGLGFCQCRLRIIQKNHIACAMLVWNFLKRFASKIGKSIYQVKHGLLSKYLTDELKHPSIKMKVIWLEKLKVFE